MPIGHNLQLLPPSFRELCQPQKHFYMTQGFEPSPYRKISIGYT